ncbi:membrane protein [Cohnella xylanilytica]|uniref:MBL fold metallo-hydrolase n=1 Tax=Cohnella xylanilytica TaxID=557555 RepID=A0A841TX16_9BACL|nr:MBL fold metallo-hydrolase [Cohnella xylanilytica]MBB6692796.1 MBL fold metallo-hydrolase [Cohnella xylanilytica]GIO12748.1 membrane protein [Cohnella xylanilytica]
MGKRYVNADGSSNLKSFSDLRKWQKERRGKKKDLSYRVARVEPDAELLAANREKPTVTFVGHSTFLVQLGGLNIVTDPVWASRMGFSPRLSPPGVPIGSLPPIDVVVLSHAHYDHLHLGSLRRLPGDFVALVPEGLGPWFRRKGFRQVRELTWWSETRIGDVTFGFVPAKHWTRRTPWDTNASHWGGWVMRHGEDCLYFAGDSGYAGVFREIGARYGDIRVALIPIGAYEPEWFMRDSHMSPEEAVQTFADVGADIFVPMHYDAFRLADDTPKEALDRLLAEWERRGLPPERLWAMELGRTKTWSADEARFE